MKTIHCCISSGSGYVISDVPNSTRDSTCAVTEVPDELSFATVITKMNQLAFWPWPKTISWPEVADLPAGSLIKPKPP